MLVAQAPTISLRWRHRLAGGDGTCCIDRLVSEDRHGT
jgi:hypothetical protein